MGDGKRRQHFASSTSIPACIVAIYIYMLSGVIGSPEFDLKAQLLAGYDKHSRPVKNHTKPITVFMDMALQQISDLDERNQIIRTSVWMRWYWTDEYLVWEPSNHSSIVSLHMSPAAIWTPDIALYNNVKAEEADWPDKYDVCVTSTGSVSWRFPDILETSCKIDVTKFPYDTQICYFKLGSWSFNGYQIDLQNKTISGDIAAFMDNGIWILQRLSVTRNVIYYNCCTEPYPDITFAATLQRRSLFYTVNLILPCILFTILNLFAFLLPVESGEKISLNVTILLALDVFLLLVAESMPEQSEVVPDIGIYLIACNVVISLSIICSVLVIHLYYRGAFGHSVPKWVRRHIIFGIGRCLGYRERLGVKTRYEYRPAQAGQSARDGYGMPIISCKSFGDTNTTPTRKTSLASSDSVSIRSMTPLKLSVHAAYIAELPDATPSSQSTDISHKEDGTNDVMDHVRNPVMEWQAVSLVMNRLLAMILTISTLALTVYSLSHIN